MPLPFYSEDLMQIFFLKSILSILLVAMALFAMFTMFEILGRAEKRYNIERLRKIHKINGILYIALFLLITWFCLRFFAGAKTELSPRAAFHSIFALTIIILLGLKVSFVRVYRQFYGKVQTIGLLIALTTFIMAGLSGGYYLLVTKFGTDKTFSGTVEGKKGEARQAAAGKEGKWAVRTDADSICKGKELYDSKCYFCHDAYSTKTGVGPGHKGLLKNPVLPVSKKSATPENIANQILHPYKDMPAFSYLADNDIQSLIAFLNTL